MPKYEMVIFYESTATYSLPGDFDLAKVDWERVWSIEETKEPSGHEVTRVEFWDDGGMVKSKDFT